MIVYKVTNIKIPRALGADHIEMKSTEIEPVTCFNRRYSEMSLLETTYKKKDKQDKCCAFSY